MPPPAPETSSQAILEPGNDLWQGYALLHRICAVESNYDAAGATEPLQFLPDGEPNWGFDKDPITGKGFRVKRDVGACQISTWAWKSVYSKMGLDVVHSEHDNIVFAEWIFDHYSWHPWIASKIHWDPTNSIQ